MDEIFEEAKERMPSQKEQVFVALQEAGKKGVTNDKLNEICFRYGSAIYCLKLDGYDILTENLGNGLVNYILLDTPLKKIDYKKGIDVVKEEIDTVYGGIITAKDLIQILDGYSLNIVRKPNGLNRKSVVGE